MLDINISINILSLYKKEGNTSPLYNLFEFIVKTICSRDFQLFKLLLDKYKPSLNRDPKLMNVNKNIL